MSITLPAPVQGYIAASNAFDGDALIEWFADDALVNDTRREFGARTRSGPGSTARSSATR
jgi:hypothetical protein